jgi:hypothetical protein
MPISPGQPAKLQAITDLYDEQRGTFLVQYPVLLVLGLALTGVAAFAVTGFLGYPQDTGFSSVFHQAWVLFLWLCALLITLQASIFRDKSLRSRLIASLVISALAIILVGITYFSQSLPDIIRQLLSQHKLLVTLAKSNYTYSVINFGLLAIFWADSISRWMHRARGEMPSPQINIGIESGTAKSRSDIPSLTELISGDLIAGAVLALLLAGLFWAQFLPNFVHPVDAAGVRVSINECTLSWPFGACAPALGAVALNPPTLTFIDIFQALIYLPLGLLILALSATLSGFGAVGGVDEAYLQDAHLVVPSLTERAGAAPIAEDVAITVVDTLRAALNRRARMLGSNVALSLRTVVWPCLIVVAVYSIASLSSDVESYLHSARDVQAFASWVLPAAAFGLAAVLAAVFSPALMLFRWRVAENTLRFLRLIGFIVLLTFWLFSLALMVIDRLLRFTGATEPDRHPFYPPSFATYISLGALVLFGLFFLVRRNRPARSVSAVEAAASRVSQSPGEAGTRSQL